ncbi:MAG: adenylate/guanylate cyclase domain-containing protein [Lachnospiraceae bacterium]|nr:adenylate/guanylate cyclase domain-containing protein [Butyrivibrio sp.]MCM1342237.1 adenylate/guanylate cyclase domain-containing protein [Muribaculaceae bacterium]MCM1409188.1 adenylate/guanylate cyclase domain-containing protein [Lachnospiraceae bacterium]
MRTVGQSQLKKPLAVCAAALLAGIFTILSPFLKMQYWFADSMFIREQPVDNRIKIIGIDETSLQEMGPFADWSRQQAADLLGFFDPEYAPAVIAFDINYFGDRDPEGDRALAEQAGQMDHVVMASYLVYDKRLEQTDSDGLQMNTLYIKEIEKPYAALQAASRQGFTNVIQDQDNYVRRSLLTGSSEEDTEYNFSYETYRCYMESQGLEPVEPRLSSNGSYGFDYTAEPGMYEVYSYADLVAGRCDPKVFRGSIVLVGAYSAAMMDQYMVPAARSTVMNGVEVHANHVNALLDGRTFTELPMWQSVLINVLVTVFCVILLLYGRFSVGVAGCAAVLVGAPVASRLMYQHGTYWRCFLLLVITVALLALKILTGYASERIRKHQILSVFRTYMAPQVVDELSRQNNYRIELGGRSRDIAVLFVDIRGFTSLSEGMTAEEVVDILNRYLGSVTNAIFKNGGTLDKFIGDAVMAIYNAPLDVEGYCDKAVQTAFDIIESVRAVNRELRETHGREIACGVGVHCGKAVVGNIGCEYRMDYTAIGDTVNIAERLESIAKGGEVLVSGEVYERIREHYQAEPIGEQSLKGRQDKVLVYRMKNPAEQE